MADITSSDELLNKEDMDFKVEVGKNDDGDKIVRVLSRSYSKEQYALVYESLADVKRAGEIIRMPTELEQLQSFLNNTTLALNKTERAQIQAIINRLSEDDDVIPIET